jgi:tRNA-dihydrouridine synthase
VRLVLAPLLGVTNAAFRRVFPRHFGGFTSAMAPFITTVHGVVPGARAFKDLSPQERGEVSLPLEPQLLGKDGADFALAANWLHDAWGYTSVNWNMGCPAGTVTARSRGSGILPHPDLVDGFLAAVFRTLKVPLTVKMRLGLRDPEEFRAVMPVLNRYPVAEVTIHPRTGKQGYGGQVDRERFAQAMALCRHPVLYNGDITSTAAAREVVDRFPSLVGLMVGRGAVAHPWLAEAISRGVEETTLVDLGRLRGFHDDMLAEYLRVVEGGPRPVVDKMKELWRHFGVHAVGGEKAQRRVLKSRSLEEYRAHADEALGR